jgi:hypothetical protein
MNNILIWRVLPGKTREKIPKGKRESSSDINTRRGRAKSLPSCRKRVVLAKPRPSLKALEDGQEEANAG